jgi:tRNA pseudouridine38-40 synthase
MALYRLVIAYDGTAYAGWQRQRDRVTVAGMIEKRFEDVFQMPCRISGASRTDAGVHALGQVAKLSTELQVDARTLKQVLNAHLPSDILVRSIVRDDMFNPFEHVEEKTYWYHIFMKRPLPVYARYGWYVRQPMSIDDLDKSLQVFKGTHDFRAFCSVDDEDDITVRTINQIEFKYIRRLHAYRIIVKGAGFSRYMIRRIVGAAVTVALRKRLTIKDIHKTLQAALPNPLFQAAPACGLMLRKIVYGNH